MQRVDPKQLDALFGLAAEEAGKGAASAGKGGDAGGRAASGKGGAEGAGRKGGQPNGKAGGQQTHAAAASAGAASTAAGGAGEPDYITIDEFARPDLRVARVISCEAVEGSVKLLRFMLDIGEEKPRQVFSGIAAFYRDPAALVGRNVIVVANLKPRKMKFGVSEGMILSASGATDDEGVFLLSPDSGAKAGMKVS